MNTLVYVAYLQGTDLPIIDSTRGATATIMILGAFGGCALGSAEGLYRRDQSVSQRFYVVIASALGVTALAAGVIGLIGDAEGALGVLFYATIALWFVATLRHMLTASAASPLTRDTHEVIDRNTTKHA
ncbi:hypothetical protein [Nonomuraea sp. NPDC048916]|uniref:hypothetical protein n=1 Tax=Nonomuraea sp. NPDC048916 TaxID=3154232 RepID=UPI0033EDAF94